MARAQLVLQNKNCSYQADLKTFVVQGTSCAHAVKLFPQAACTCPAKKECYHILAAKLYMGIEVKNKRRRITMTQLRRNLKPKSSKRKGPLQEDEVEPALDAKVHTHTYTHQHTHTHTTAHTHTHNSTHTHTTAHTHTHTQQHTHCTHTHNSTHTHTHTHTLHTHNSTHTLHTHTHTTAHTCKYRTVPSLQFRVDQCC